MPGGLQGPASAQGFKSIIFCTKFNAWRSHGLRIQPGPQKLHILNGIQCLEASWAQNMTRVSKASYSLRNSMLGGLLGPASARGFQSLISSTELNASRVSWVRRPPRDAVTPGVSE